MVANNTRTLGEGDVCAPGVQERSRAQPRIERCAIRSKLPGHALQLADYALTLLGLGATVAAMYLAANYPTVPFWAFVLASVAFGAPLMIAGGRINSRGKGQLMGWPPDETDSEYRRETIWMAAHIGFVLLIASLALLPLIARASGRAHPSGTFFSTWMASWVLVLCAEREWTTRPLCKAIARRLPCHRRTRPVRLPNKSQERRVFS